jgi:hypothetical protein
MNAMDKAWTEYFEELEKIGRLLSKIVDSSIELNQTAADTVKLQKKVLLNNAAAKDRK